MKSIGNKSSKRIPRRDLFAELDEGLRALAEERQGKRTLRHHAVELPPPPETVHRR